MKKTIYCLAVALLAGGTILTGCKKKKTEEVPVLGSEAYIISSSPQGGGNQIINLPSSVESGQISISTGHEGYDFFAPQKIGNAIYCHSETGFYQKYTLGENSLNLAEIPVINGGEVIRAYNNNTKAIASNSWQEDNGPVGFDIINLNNFTVEHSGNFNLYKPADTLAYDLANPYPLNGKFYFPYSLYKPTSEERIDTSYVAIYDAATYQLIKVLKEPRVQGLGSNEDIKPYVQGNFIYFMSQEKSIPGMAHKVLRLNTSTDEFDNFEFELPAVAQDLFFYNLHDIGNGKAIVLSYDADITTDFIYEYWMIDIVNQTFEKLNIPASSQLYYRYFLDIPGNKVAIACNSANGNFVYTYDKGTGAITKGMEYVGGYIHELSGPLTK